MYIVVYKTRLVAKFLNGGKFNVVAKHQKL